MAELIVTLGGALAIAALFRFFFGPAPQPPRSAAGRRRS